MRFFAEIRKKCRKNLKNTAIYFGKTVKHRKGLKGDINTNYKERNELDLVKHFRNTHNMLKKIKEHQRKCDKLRIMGLNTAFKCDFLRLKGSI